VVKVLLRDCKGKTINQWNFKGKCLDDRLDLIDDYDPNTVIIIWLLAISV